MNENSNWLVSNPEEEKFKQLTNQNKSGYLNENFHLFYIKDKREISFDYHYHDFHKIVVLLQGNVTYEIEGKSYELKPYDMLLVPMHKIHRPNIDSSSTYERYVIWISNDYLSSLADDRFTNKVTNNSDSALTKTTGKAYYNNILEKSLIRTEKEKAEEYIELLKKAYLAEQSDSFGSKRLSASYMDQFIILLSRFVSSPDFKEDASSIYYNKKIEQIIQYINANLTDNLSNEELSKIFYQSKYHLMHMFKKETGYTLHAYIKEKRLILAANLLKEGYPVSDVWDMAGFSEYSTFLRAFKSKYKRSPSSF
ncbi:MAG: AraC family transcriptional regulator [Lachnospiraceae bacterium]|nr:AraC family transcriptional regulator [Lachnospiraceae bacterium]